MGINGRNVGAAYYNGVQVFPTNYFYTLEFRSCLYSTGNTVLANATNYAYSFECAYKQFRQSDSALVSTIYVYPTPVSQRAYFSVDSNGYVRFDKSNYGKTVVGSGTYNVTLSYGGINTTGTFSFGGNSYSRQYSITNLAATVSYFYASGGTSLLSGGHLISTSAFTSGDRVDNDLGTGSVSFSTTLGVVNYPGLAIPSLSGQVKSETTFTVSASYTGAETKNMTMRQQANTITASSSTLSVYVGGNEVTSYEFPYTGGTIAVTARADASSSYTSNYVKTTSYTQTNTAITGRIQGNNWVKLTNNWMLSAGTNTTSSQKYGSLLIVQDTNTNKSTGIALTQDYNAITSTTTAVTALTITLGTPALIPASGGCVSSTTYSVTAYEQEVYHWRYGNDTTGSTTAVTVTNQVTPTWSGYRTIDSLYDNITGETFQYNLRADVSFSGKSANKSVQVKQQENKKETWTGHTENNSYFISASTTVTGSSNNYDATCSVSPTGFTIGENGGTINYTTTGTHKKDFYVQTVNHYSATTHFYSSITFTSKYIGREDGSTTGTTVDEDEGTVTVTSGYTDTPSVTSYPSWTYNVTTSSAEVQGNGQTARTGYIKFSNYGATAQTKLEQDAYVPKSFVPTYNGAQITEGQVIYIDNTDEFEVIDTGSNNRQYTVSVQDGSSYRITGNKIYIEVTSSTDTGVHIEEASTYGSINFTIIYQ